MGFVALHLLGSRKGRGRAKRGVDSSWPTLGPKVMKDIHVAFLIVS